MVTKPLTIMETPSSKVCLPCFFLARRLPTTTKSQLLWSFSPGRAKSGPTYIHLQSSIPHPPSILPLPETNHVVFSPLKIRAKNRLQERHQKKKKHPTWSPTTHRESQGLCHEGFLKCWVSPTTIRVFLLKMDQSFWVVKWDKKTHHFGGKPPLKTQLYEIVENGENVHPEFRET